MNLHQDSGAVITWQASVTSIYAVNNYLDLMQSSKRHRHMHDSLGNTAAITS
jgi:hypothetical protein